MAILLSSLSGPNAGFESVDSSVRAVGFAQRLKAAGSNWAATQLTLGQPPSVRLGEHLPQWVL